MSAIVSEPISFRTLQGRLKPPLAKLAGLRKRIMLVALAALLFCIGNLAFGAGTTGAALQPAFDALNELTGGYGKQLLVIVGFVAAAFSLLAANATSAILKFIGYVVFLAVGLTAGITLSGAMLV
jgi:hypothetical protein